MNNGCNNWSINTPVRVPTFGFFTAEIWKDLMSGITNKKARILFRLVAVTFWPIWWSFWAVMVVIALIVMGIGYLFEIE